ncbi:MAG: GIY-YIG nuclease family protein [Hyphomonadaceae bacterium]
MNEDRVTAVYMLASKRHGTLYLGSAMDLAKRVWEHREGIASKFTARYGVTRLVWYEPFIEVTAARTREYEMKKWRRDWKTNLIERDNPNWDDLYFGLIGAVARPAEN